MIPGIYSHRNPYIEDLVVPHILWNIVPCFVELILHSTLVFLSDIHGILLVLLQFCSMAWETNIDLIEGEWFYKREYAVPSGVFAGLTFLGVNLVYKDAFGIFPRDLLGVSFLQVTHWEVFLMLAGP